MDEAKEEKRTGQTREEAQERRATKETDTKERKRN